MIAGERHATTRATVELYLHGAPGAEQMRLRNDSGPWSPWRTFAPRIVWTLAAGDGHRTVYAEVRAGGAIHLACDSIWQSGAGPPANSSEPVACEDDGTFRAGEP